MMECQVVIKMGRSQMKVQFTDGSATGYGMNPAMYTTDNLMVQRAIENSDHFKRGRIYEVCSVDLDDEVVVIRNPREKEAPMNSDISDVSDHSDAPDISDGVKVEAAVDKTAEAEEKALTEMEFDNNDDARDYLEANFGYVRSKLRNRADIVAAGEAKGIVISFT